MVDLKRENEKELVQYLKTMDRIMQLSADSGIDSHLTRAQQLKQLLDGIHLKFEEYISVVENPSDIDTQRADQKDGVDLDSQ